MKTVLKNVLFSKFIWKFVQIVSIQHLIVFGNIQEEILFDEFSGAKLNTKGLSNLFDINLIWIKNYCIRSYNFECNGDITLKTWEDLFLIRVKLKDKVLTKLK